MANGVTFGVRLQGDAGGAVKAMTLTRSELDKLQRELGQTARKAEQVDDSFRGWAEGMLDARNILGSLAGVIGVGMLAQFTRQAITATAQIGNMADATGVSAETLQELLYVFQQFDTTIELTEVVEALGTISDRAQDAKDGTQSFIDDFALIGITVDELRGKNPAELFSLFAEAIQNTEDSGKRLTAAMRAFGDDLGLKLLPVLERGADGIADMATEANELSDELTAVMQRADRDINDLADTLRNQWRTSVAQTLQDLYDIGDAISDAFSISTEERISALVTEIEQLERAEARLAKNNAVTVELLDKIAAKYRLLADLREKSNPEEPISIVGGQQQSLPPVSLPGIPDLSVPIPSVEDIVRAQSRMDWLAEEQRIFGKTPKTGLLLDLPETTDSVEDLKDKLAELNDTSVETTDAGRALGFTFQSAFEDAILEAESFRDVLRGLAEDIQRIILRQSFTKPLAEGISGAVSGISGGGGFWSSITSAFASSFGGKKAAGGPVMGGTPYIVGERGPELFIPGMSGGIVPNHSLGGITVAPVINMDLRGADKSAVPQLNAVVQRLPGMIKGVMVDDLARGGEISRAMGR